MRLPGLLAALAAAGFTALTCASPARANLLITVDQAAQIMTVTVDGDPRYVWQVATGREGHNTPTGDFKPFRMERDHFSREWDDAPMPYSIFFTMQGHAIHGTNHTITGEPASHGCVRLSVAHAAILWGLVKEYKMANTRVVLTGHIPSAAELMARRGPNGPGIANPGAEDGGNGGNIRRNEATLRNDEFNDDDVTGNLPPPEPSGRGVWREYRENGRVYYYREGPQEVRRVNRRVYRRVYRYDRRYGGGFPFW